MMIAGVIAVSGFGTSSRTRFPVEAGEGEGDAAGVAEGDNPQTVEVE